MSEQQSLQQGTITTIRAIFFANPKSDCLVERGDTLTGDANRKDDVFAVAGIHTSSGYLKIGRDVPLTDDEGELLFESGISEEERAARLFRLVGEGFTTGFIVALQESENDPKGPFFIATVDRQNMVSLVKAEFRSKQQSAAGPLTLFELLTAIHQALVKPSAN